MWMFYFSSIIIFIGALSWLIKKWFSKDDWKIVGPMGVLMLCYLAYCGFGPALVMSFSGDKNVTYLGVDLADYAFTSGLISLVSFISVMIGYRMTKDKIPADVVTVTPPQKLGSAWHWGLWLYFLGFIVLIIVHRFSFGNMYNIAGGDLTEMALQYDLGGFTKYIHGLNGLMRAMSIFLVLVALFSKSLFKMAIAGFLFCNTCLLVLASGFRQQIAFLFLMVICMLILYYRGKPNWTRGGKKNLLVKISWLVVGLFFLISAMSIGRSYGKGVDFERVSQTSFAEKLVAPFSETASVYFSGGLTCEYVERRGEYTYLKPLWATLLRAIPRQWCSLEMVEAKDNPPTLFNIYSALSEENGAPVEQNRAAGMATLSYYEYYQMFGWLGVVLLSALLGSVCKRIENYKAINPGFITSLSYILHSGFIFIYFHRGMMGQQANSYVFGVLIPLLLVKYFNKKSAFDLWALLKRRVGIGRNINQQVPSNQMPPQFSGRCQQRPHVGGYYNRFPQTQKQSQTDNNLKK